MKLFCFVFLFYFSILPATAVVVEGRHKDYAGKKLEFFRYSDPVTLEKTHVFTLEVDAEGNFSTEAEIDQTTFVFSDFGIYRGMLFLETGKNVKLKLPPLREKSFADQKNPYFKPVDFWFATENGNQLNDRISAFDTRLNQLTDRFFDQIYFNQSKAAFDSLKMDLKQKFGNINSGIFAFHQKFKIKAIETDAFRLPSEKVSSELDWPEPALQTHPAFIQLFEKLFAGKLSFEVRSSNGKEIRQAVSAGNISFFRTFTEDKYGLKGQAADLVILKILHDAYYSGDFSQNDILKLVNAVNVAGNTNKNIKTIAGNVLQKLKHLQKGSKAPVICLKNTNGRRVCTNEGANTNEDKFKYLIFADTEMIVCREHLKYLTKTFEQFDRHLEIIVVLRKTDLIEMKIFLDKENIPGIHLVDETGEFIEKYRVKSFPACFLLNENHEVVFQQAKAPLDGFEQQFGVFLRQELFKRQRNQSR